MKFKTIKKAAIIILILLIRIFPYIVQNDIIAVQSDNLDSNVPNFMVLKYTNSAFSISNDKTIEMIGVENNFKRNYLLSGYNITTLFFYTLPPIIAYKLNYLLSILIGFFGIYLLIPLISIRIPFTLNILIAISFTFMPWFHVYNCGYVAAVPFLIYAVINLYKFKRIKLSLFILLIFPFFSSLFLTSFFAFIYYGIFLLYLILKKEFQAFKILSFGYIILIFSSIISELNILNLMLFDKTFKSHRAIREIDEFNFSNKIHGIIKILKHGRVHAVSNHNYIDYFIVIAIFISAYYFFKKKEKLNFLPFLVLGFLVFNTILSETANQIFRIPFLKGFDYSRFSILNPTIVYIAFVLFLDLIFQFKNFAVNLIGLFFIPYNLYFTAKYSDYKANLVNSYNKISYNEREKYNGLISFNDFYATNIFEKCKTSMSKIEEKPVCVALGIYPGILNFNNINTIDHYTNNYSLEYKDKFRRIIEGEINKSEEIKSKFDDYGNRCYLFSKELLKKFDPPRGGLISKFEEPIHIKNLAIDTKALTDMNCNFIISSVIIDNRIELNLELIDSITYRNSIYNIYIYHIKK